MSLLCPKNNVYHYQKSHCHGSEPIKGITVLRLEARACERRPFRLAHAPPPPFASHHWWGRRQKARPLPVLRCHKEPNRLSEPGAMNLDRALSQQTIEYQPVCCV